MPINLEPAHISQVQTILKEYVPECEAWVFGSRAVGTAKRFSDLDLVLVAEQEIPVRQLALLANAFEESDLPFKVDLVDYRSASSAFKEQITRSREIVFSPR